MAPRRLAEPRTGVAECGSLRLGIPPLAIRMMRRAAARCERAASQPAVPALWPTNPQVLRLEPHVVISNRTPVPLQLLQSRLTLVTPQPAAGGRGAALQRPSGAVVAEGGCSFSAASSRGLSASPLWTGGAPFGGG